jgi:hypothetical protein
LLDIPAYRDRDPDGDECGTVEIAKRSVAASFVGATAGAMVIAEAVRALRHEHRYEVIDGSLRGLEGIRAVAIDGARPIDNTGFGYLE